MLLPLCATLAPLVAEPAHRHGAKGSGFEGQNRPPPGYIPPPSDGGDDARGRQIVREDYI